MILTTFFRDHLTVAHRQMAPCGDTVSILSLPMKAGQLVVGGSRRAPTPSPDEPTGSPESARPRVSFLSLLFRGAAPLAALNNVVLVVLLVLKWCHVLQPLCYLVEGEP